MTADYLALQEEAHHLARQLFGQQAEKVAAFTDRLMDIYTRVRDKDFLLIHNPGGWGNNVLEHCIQWERNVVAGTCATIERLGYTPLLVQHLRSGTSWWERIRDMRDQFGFFAAKARLLATEVEFITGHLDNLKVVLIGASQGAAFVNAVMQQLPSLQPVYSIELGMFFPYISRRVITERTLSLDWNGMVPDAAVRRDLMAGFRAYTAAPFRWAMRWLQGRPVKFSNCVNVRGHNYDWGYPYVQRRVVDFLETNFGNDTKGESGMR